MIVKNVAGKPVELRPQDVEAPLSLSERSWLTGRNVIFITNSKLHEEEIFDILCSFPTFDYREAEPVTNTEAEKDKLLKFLDLLKNSGVYQLSEGPQLSTALYIVVESCKREAVQEQQRNLRYLMGIVDSDVEDVEEANG